MEIPPKLRRIRHSTYQEVVLFMLSPIKELNPDCVIADDRDNQGAFPVEIQDWVAQTTIQTLVSGEVKKFAVVRPQDYISNVATELAVEEAKKIAKSHGIKIEMFGDFEGALAWVKADNMVPSS